MPKVELKTQGPIKIPRVTRSAQAKEKVRQRLASLKNAPLAKEPVDAEIFELDMDNHETVSKADIDSATAKLQQEFANLMKKTMDEERQRLQKEFDLKLANMAPVSSIQDIEKKVEQQVNSVKQHTDKKIEVATNQLINTHKKLSLNERLIEARSRQMASLYK